MSKLDVAVVGEALIDLLPVPADGPDRFSARPGGSPFNVAVGLARQGCSTALFARLGDNAFGRLLRAHATDEGIDLSYAPLATESTTLAVVNLNENAQATYDFYVTGTADWQWQPPELVALPTAARVVHFGSIASWFPPGGDVILDAVTRTRREGAVLVSYDPNLRPSLLGSPLAAVPLVEAAVAAAHVVKASREDVEWLYPALALAEVGERWIGLGASLVVITDGAAGARAVTATGVQVQRPGRPVHVVDTVGAGDAFTAGLLAALHRRDRATPAALAGLTSDLLPAVIDEAILVSALTCERAGADPPRRRGSDFTW